MECPEESLILDLLAGALPPTRAEALHLHLDRCSLCQRLVGELARAEALGLPLERPGEVPPLVPGARLDRYFILGQVGAGGMSVVYAAFDPALDRKVALKLLHRPQHLGGSPEQQHRWLLAEAQALARLSHPHVVTVYEARVIGEQIFLALEFSDGGTLETWLRERPRSWREALAVFLAAGEGLGAAHAAGIVHRDFKPSNVLIRRDGHVQVTDFGLARLIEGTGGPRAMPELPGASRSASGASMTTWRGALVGTPAYMAPEQWEGGKVDARADQFSFCVALYEALFGRRPAIEGGNPEASRRPAAGEGPVPMPRSPRVPRHIRRALQRGLSRAPEERFASMGELLKALAREPLVAWRIPLAATAALCLVVVGVVLGAAREEPRPCQGGESRLVRVWDPERRQAVHEALLSAGGPSAEAAWKSVESALNSYATAWVAHYTEACEATRVRGEQSEALLDARIQCLDRRARDLQALTELLARQRDRAANEAIQAAWRLPALESCAAPHAQAAVQGLPTQGPVHEQAQAIARGLSEVRALKSTGQYRLALEKAVVVREQLRELDHAPTRAEVFLELGSLHIGRGEAQKAEEALLEAAWAAEAGRYDRAAAEARLGLVFVYGDMLMQPAVGAAYVRQAQAAVARLGGDAKLEAQLEQMLGSVLMEQDRCAEALPHIERAKVLTDKVAPPGSPTHIAMLITLGRGFQCTRDLSAARAAFKQAVSLREEALGPEHPLVAVMLLFEGRVAFEQHDSVGGLALFQRALDILQRTGGARSEQAAIAHSMLAAVLLQLDRLEEARQGALESLALLEELGTQHPTRKAYTWSVLGEAEARLGRRREGLQLLEQALQITDRHHPASATTLRMTIARLLSESPQELPRARQLALESYRELARNPRVPPKDLEDAQQLLKKLGLSPPPVVSPEPLAE